MPFPPFPPKYLPSGTERERDEEGGVRRHGGRVVDKGKRKEGIEGGGGGGEKKINHSYSHRREKDKIEGGRWKGK